MGGIYIFFVINSFFYKKKKKTKILNKSILESFILNIFYL
jgi:hypothetical protein